MDSKPNIAVLEASASDAVPLLDHSMIYNAFDDIETGEFEENNTNADLEELKQRLLEQDIKDDIFSMENVELELSNIVKDHDHVYYSVNFGEVLIKELLMCSMFGVQVFLFGLTAEINPTHLYNFCHVFCIEWFSMEFLLMKFF